MAAKRWLWVIALFFASSAAADTSETSPPDEQHFLGPEFKLQSAADVQQSPSPPPRFSNAADAVRHWNRIAIDASGLDHTPVQPGESRIFGEQLGPGRSARAMAIVHIAMFDAVNAILGGYRSYTGIAPVSRRASLDAAIAQAAHDTLVELFPSQTATLDRQLSDALAVALARDEAAKRDGIAAGRRAAAKILDRRENDGSIAADPYMGSEWITSDEAGHWRQDPISLAPIALGAKWGKVKPFVLRSGSQFVAAPPPLMTSADYTRAFNEVKALGGDGVHTPTERTAEQTEIALFWAYDGTPTLCAPPRLYNQITTEISERETNPAALARLFALVNVAMADASIGVWESKFRYDVWRPVTGIREADEGTGPTGAGDGNPATIGDEEFWPLGAPASNLTGPNFTPPFPAYPSGHAGIGAALFQTLRRYYGTDAIAFTFVSDELNGETVGNDGVVRPYAPRTFSSLSKAEEENGQSRIYLGIHWAFDKTGGIAQGRRIANYIYNNAFQPLSR